ncbi:uracil-DNA glycosylase family protein [Agarivorans sp. MS3-6]
MNKGAVIDPIQPLTGLLADIRACRLCAKQFEPRPVIQASKEARLLIIGQAPGLKVHQSGVPWDDVSGKRLREWLGIDEAIFYNPQHVAIVPSGFCYPGKGKHGDLPPPKICFATWHQQVLAALPEVKLTLLIGQYAQALYLPNATQRKLTDKVANFEQFSQLGIWPLPHPSPRNRHWLAANPWFEQTLLPKLKMAISELLFNKA